MADRFLHEVLTPSVLAAERHYYGRTYATDAEAPETEPLGPEERAFIERRDSFYMATTTENGWPYVQHRGGPRGFLRVTGPNELMFGDYGGNRQMVSVGSLSAHDRVCLFLMDYAAQERLKILGHAQVHDARSRPDLVAKIVPSGGLAAKVERVFVINVVSYDWNCPKFITPRLTSDEIEIAIAPLKSRLAELERQLKERASSAP